MARNWVNYWVDLKLPDEVWELIRSEYERQVKKWGIQNHAPSEWLMFLTEEVGELSEAIGNFWFRDGGYEEMEAEAVQVATLAIKMAYMCRCAREDAEAEFIPAEVDDE